MKTRYLLLVLLLLAPWLMSDCIQLGGSEEYQRRLTSAMIAGEGPDVGYLDSLLMPEYAAQDWLMPVPDEINLEGFYSATVEPFRWKGTQYAVPHDTQTVALIVNQDILDETGYLPPQNWDEFNEIIYGLADPDAGVYGLGMTSGFWSFLPFLYQAGGELVDENGQLVLNTDQALLALGTYFQPALDGYVLVFDGQEGFEEGGTSGLLGAFVDGKIAMFIGGPTMYSEVLQRMRLDPTVQTTVQVHELPAGPAGPATIAFTRGLALFRQADNELEPGAVDFLNYATSEKGLSFWIGDSSTPPDYIPARPSLAGQWLEQHPDTRAFVVGLEYAQNYQPDDVPSTAYREFYDMASGAFAQTLRGELSVREAQQTIQEQGTEILQGYR
jgi:multiple sugar transport system substrate-binding protein